MGNLTDDMRRLRGEVETLRGAREALLRDISRGAGARSRAVSAMRADFREAHSAMAQRTGRERKAFVAAMTGEVQSLLGTFSREREGMARKGRDDRGIFLLGLKRQVSAVCKATADDLTGARFAWRGAGSRSGKAMVAEPVTVAARPVSPPPKEDVAPELMVVAPESAEATVRVETAPPKALMEPPPEKEQVTMAIAPEMAEEPLVEPQAKMGEENTVLPDPTQNVGERGGKSTMKAKRGGRRNS